VPKSLTFPFPFIHWAGGKRQLLPQLSALAPTKYERYFEPFLGAGAFFFHLISNNNNKINSAYISDINSDLINAYTALEDTKAGDFIYFDPPYHAVSDTSYFTGYNVKNFLEQEQKHLAKVFLQLHEMKCNVMLTNSNTPLLLIPTLS
jgi:site-specific DNA-adenine methylase